jgi:energy-coupling factor transporter ATP-binding protein EcfA2
VFGANSAGKSTLMYTLSGIMEDIRRKEEMAGGERITIRGEIRFNGKDITALKPSVRARGGNYSLSGEASHFSREYSIGKPQDWSVLGNVSTGQRNPRICLHYLFSLEETGKKTRRLPERRGAADARHWEGVDGAT